MVWWFSPLSLSETNHVVFGVIVFVQDVGENTQGRIRIITLVLPSLNRSIVFYEVFCFFVIVVGEITQGRILF